MEAFEPELRVLGQALVALFLGGVVGWERETAGKWAGLRTHMLICLAAMLFVKMGEFLIVNGQEKFHHEVLRTDPIRIVEAIVTGIAFIGAGTIFRDADRNVARGLTTAASMLVVGPIGVAVAAERYVLAVGATVLVFIVLRGLNWFEIRARLKCPPPETQPRSHGRPPRFRPRNRGNRGGMPPGAGEQGQQS
ncbi:MAG: MgtC/SapB family protein [Verrucomicrobiia bacterium]